MGEEDRSRRLMHLQEELVSLGQAFYSFQQEVEEKSQEFFQRLEWIESEVQNHSFVEQEYQILQYRVARHQDFGEPLD